MRFLVSLLAVAGSASAADWKLVGHDDDITAYYHPASIRKSGNTVRLWTLNDYEKGQRVEGRVIRSIKSQHEFDCAAKKRRQLFAAIHPNQMGKGIPVYVGLNPTQWEPVVPDSGEAYLWAFACAKRTLEESG
jgi:hypothetical protein